MLCKNPGYKLLSSDRKLDRYYTARSSLQQLQFCQNMRQHKLLVMSQFKHFATKLTSDQRLNVGTTSFTLNLRTVISHS